MYIQIVLVFLLAGSLNARAPQMINYQGKLIQGGVPFSGNQSVIFRIYPVSSGGSALWSSDVQTVHMTNGIFNTWVGQTTSLGSPIPFSNIIWASNEKYLEVQVDSDVLQPRERLTSVPYALYADNGVPAGTIMLWSGSIATIPTGWALCDGLIHDGKLTPNLRDRFVIGAGTSYTPDSTGGGTTHSHTVNSHSHTMSHTHDISHTHTMAHTHTYSGTTGNTSISEWVDRATSSMRWQPQTDPHSHSYSGTTDGASPGSTGGASTSTSGGSSSGSTGSDSPGTSSVNHLPSYYALAYIMKL
ncbi:MAG: hypothetical protein PHF84_02065 [bacterium]|nr:hypothetical protein [bacterium]